MAIIPFFRVIIFSEYDLLIYQKKDRFLTNFLVLITLFSLVVLGICAHIDYLVAGYTNLYMSFAPFGLGTACLTILSLPLL